VTTGTKRVALAAIFISTLAIGSAYASAFRTGGAPAWAGWLFAAGVTGALVATLALGAMRPERGLGRLIGPFLLMTVLIGAGFIAVFALPELGAAEPLLLGLPRRAAIVLYGIGLLPTLVLPVAYALTFADQTLRPEDLARVLATARAARETRDRNAETRA
jgi:hypothetical protein